MCVKNVKKYLLQTHAQSLLFLFALIAIFSLVAPYFLTPSNIHNVIAAAAVIGLLAAGATFIVGSGGIDLSSGSVMALSGTSAALLAVNMPLPSFVVVFFAILVGGLCGAVNGIFLSLTRAPSFIITLGMLSIARAIAYIISDASTIYGLPENISLLGQGDLFGISGPVWFLIAGIIVGWIILRFSRFGTHALLVGDNAAAAHAMGIQLSALRIKLYSLAGAYAGLGGFVFMARTNSGDPTSGQNYELLSITAVILGGANLFGGRASMIGTFCGVLCLGVLQNGLNLLAVNTYYQVLFIGLVLIASAFLSRIGEKS